VYTGGAIEAGTAFTIQALTAVQVTKENIYSKVLALSTMLNDNEVPQENRWLVVPAQIGQLIRLSPEYVGIGSEGGRNQYRTVDCLFNTQVLMFTKSQRQELAETPQTVIIV
jgi:hypothetical protein